MRSISIIVTLLSFASCKPGTIESTQRGLLPENSRPHILKLIDSLGTISMNIPNRYDSFFQWTNTSDCGKPCDHEQYRFQPKHLPVFKESGFFSDTPSNIFDSTEQFTIIHSGYFPFHDGTDSGLIYKINRHQKHDLQLRPDTYKIAFDTVQKINDRYFSIITIDLFDSTKKIYSKKVFGLTSIKGNGIAFNYELLTKKHDSITSNFIRNSINLLKTVRLSKGL